MSCLPPEYIQASNDLSDYIKYIDGEPQVCDDVPWDAIEIMRSSLHNYFTGRNQAYQSRSRLNTMLRLTDARSVPLKKWAVTINPSPSWDLDEFIKRVLSLESHTYCETALFVIEQRGSTEEEMGTGFHCHAIIESGKPRSQLLQKLSDKTFPDSAVFLPPKPSSDPSQYLSYMKGDKKDPAKLIKVAIDRIWRKKYNIPSRLDYDSTPTCVENGPAVIELIE